MADEPRERETQARRQPQRVIAPGADPVEPRDPAVRSVPLRLSTALLFAAPAILLVLLGIGWMLLSEGRSGQSDETGSIIGTTGENEGTTTITPESGEEGSPDAMPPVVSDQRMLSNPERYIGRSARFAAVPVVAANGERTFWAGRVGSRSLVVLDPSIENPGVTPGQRVDVAGTFEQAPSGEALDRLRLDEEDREAVEKAGVYLRATRIEIQGTVLTPRSHTPE
ncbi:MAG TPA: hypothetical protein VNK41_04830 [Vicinamibacterales bacterium]|nr:hypothetical protein [Vicinamibacterales bacterium]